MSLFMAFAPVCGKVEGALRALRLSGLGWIGDVSSVADDNVEAFAFRVIEGCANGLGIAVFVALEDVEGGFGCCFAFRVLYYYTQIIL